ncbi:MAG: flagellar motor protein MotB [Ignavibacteriales bacterium]
MSETVSNSDRYLITYSDLITLLLGLFIILYAISNIDLTKYQKMMTAMGSIFGNSGDIPTLNDTKRDVVNTPNEKLKDDLNTVIKRYHYDKSVTLEENERGIVVHILDDILFPSGQAEPTEQSKKILHQLALILRDLPNDIRIEGHTDNVKINSVVYPSNWHLSVNRALNTAYYLMQNESLPPEKLSIVGYSEFKPLADNSTDEGRAKNRRVDIVIIK